MIKFSVEDSALPANGSITVQFRSGQARNMTMENGEMYYLSGGVERFLVSTKHVERWEYHYG